MARRTFRIASSTKPTPHANAGRRNRRRRSSPIGAADHIHQLGHLPALLRPAARRDGVLDAMRHMIAQNLLLGAPQRRPHRRYLRDDIDAVAILPDHAGKAANLALDSFEPLEA